MIAVLAAGILGIAICTAILLLALSGRDDD